VPVEELDGGEGNRLYRVTETGYDTYMESLPLTPPPAFTPGDDTDPGLFTDEEFIEFLTEQGFWVDNLIEN
jgi:hypothetical protein